jgi:pentatricopeptide repeat protein
MCIDEELPEIISPRPSSSYRIPNNNRSKRRRNQSLARGNQPLQSLNINLDSLAKSNQPGAAARAQELLQRIEALHQEGYYAVAPDIVSLNSVLNAWANSDEEDAAEKALELLFGEETMLEPNVISFNTILLAFAKRGAAAEAQELLHRMESDYHVQPDTISYNSLLYGYAQANQPEQAETVLKEMMQLSTQNPDINPDSISFNTVLLAWSRSGSRKACQRAEELLKHMEVLYEAGNVHVAPDVYSYTIVIQALATSRGITAASRALKLLEVMEGNPELQPNTVTYTTVMSALSKCGYKNAPKEAQNLLDRMIARYDAGDMDCRPDTVAFTAVISCWARGFEHDDADEKALDLLQLMKDMGELAPPNAMTYTSVLKALSRSQKGTSSNKAEELLNEMEEAYQAGNAALEPTSIHYNVVLDVHAKSPNYDKAVRADNLYRAMKEVQRKHTQPNIVTYNSLLRACANTFGNPQTKKKALSIANDAFQSILTSETGVEPSSITFVFFIKAIRKLLAPSEQRSEMLAKSFRYCCQLGLLNDVVLQQVKLACSSKNELSALLEMANVNDIAANEMESSNLPAEWSRNAEQMGARTANKPQ